MMSQSAGGTQTVWVYSPYAPASQPSLLAMDIDIAARPSSDGGAGWVAARKANVVQAGLLAIAIPPPPIYPRSYYGPLRACPAPFAINVRGDEGYTEVGSARILHARRGGFILETFIYDLERDRDIVRPLETLRVSGLGPLTRIELTSRNAPSREIGYLFDTQDGGSFPLHVIRSPEFDGSEADRAVLARIAAGDAAKALCASIPPALQVRPERLDRDAEWFAPEQPDGPRTLCWSQLAIDVLAGERAIVPWRPEMEAAGVGIVTRGGSVRLGGRLASGDNPLGRPEVNGRLLGTDRYVLKWLPDAVGGPGSGSRQARIVSVKNIATFGGNPGPGINATITGAVSEADATVVLNRVRARTPSDRC